MNESVELYEESMTDGYSMEIKSQVEGALPVIQSYYDRSQSGELTKRGEGDAECCVGRKGGRRL